MSTVIKFLKNSSDIRIVFAKGVAVATIKKLETGVYEVVRVYDMSVMLFDSYSDARGYGMNCEHLKAVVA